MLVHISSLLLFFLLMFLKKSQQLKPTTRTITMESVVAFNRLRICKHIQYSSDQHKRSHQINTWMDNKTVQDNAIKRYCMT
jgi:hypothetical protein